MFRNELARKLAAARPDLAFEIAHACFTSVMTNDFENAFVGEVKLFELEPVAFSLFRHEVSLSNLEFLPFRVTGKTEYFESILKRWWNRVQDVGSRDEKYFRKIVFDVEIVILE